MTTVPKQNLALIPRAPAVWIQTKGRDAGQPTPEFYRFIISLLGLAGGSADLTLEQLEDFVLTQREVSAPTPEFVDPVAYQMSARAPLSAPVMDEQLSAQRPAPLADASISTQLDYLLARRPNTLAALATPLPAPVSSIVGTVSTTSATPAIIATIAIPINTSVLAAVSVAARRTGGTAGSTGDAGGYQLQALIKNITGTLTIVNQTLTYNEGDQPAWTPAAAISGTNIQFQVTGAANNNIDWLLSGQSIGVA